MTETSDPTRNITADGVRIRAFFGVLFFVFALGMMALLTVVDAPIVIRTTVFIPAWISALSLLQARAGTCVFLAARGACSTDMGPRRLADESVRQFFTRRAGRIHLQSLITAFLMTILLVSGSILIPWRVPPG